MLGSAATGPRCPHTLRRLTRAGVPPGAAPNRGSAEARPVRGRVTPTAAFDDRETRMSIGSAQGARSELASSTHDRAQPEFVQLLTPDGTRVEHPDYDVDFTHEELRG